MIHPQDSLFWRRRAGVSRARRPLAASRCALRPAMASIAPAQRQSFEEFGFAVLRGVLSPTTCEHLKLVRRNHHALHVVRGADLCPLSNIEICLLYLAAMFECDSSDLRVPNTGAGKS